jgi:hypothetical protein
VRNLVRYVPSGKFFARIRVKGKLLRRSLKTSTLSVAKLRLADLEKSERQAVEHAVAYEGGKMTSEMRSKSFASAFRDERAVRSITSLDENGPTVICGHPKSFEHSPARFPILAYTVLVKEIANLTTECTDSLVTASAGYRR